MRGLRPRSEVKRLLEAARTCARRAGSDSIEAEHLLLALASTPLTVAHAVLSNAGLDEQRITEALAVEQAESLATVGVTALASPPPAYVDEVKQLGQSARLAITRAAVTCRARKERPMRAAHVLIGLLSAEVGRVPRALAVAQVDRAKLLAEAHAALDSYLKRAS